MRVMMLALAAIACAPGAALGQDVAARIANINNAAAEIAVIQDRKGNNGAVAAIDACYKRELPKATNLTPGLEACMAQDIIVAKMSAALYARLSANLSEEQRKKAGVPDLAAVTKAMAERIYGILGRLKVPESDARAFNQIVQTQGMETFVKARFPNKQQ